jgi:hypothetical protein
MGGHAARGYWEDKGLMLLWFSFLAAPTAWALAELIGYALVKPVCFGDATFALTAVNGAAFALVIAGALVGRACLLRARGGSDDGGRDVDRSYFMAVVAIAFNALVGLLIVFATISHFVLSPCE